jgi:hypothetical protein
MMVMVLNAALSSSPQGCHTYHCHQILPIVMIHHKGMI